MVCFIASVTYALTNSVWSRDHRTLPAMANHRETAREMMARRVGTSTTDLYRSKLKVMGEWMKKNRGTVDEDGFPMLPLDPEVTLSFFGGLVEKRSETAHEVFGKSKRNLVENGGHIAPSTAGGYKSALVWLYAEKEMTMTSQLNKNLNMFMSGYKKQVRDKSASSTNSQKR